MRISVQEDLEHISIKIEGRLAGPWAAELGAVWKQLSVSRNGREVELDLRDVTYVDEQGMSVLRHIYEETNARLKTCSPLTKYFAEQVRLNDQHSSQTDNGDENHV